MRARRAAAIWALLAFLLGVALGPVLGWERETVVVTESSNMPLSMLRSYASDGWAASRTDVARADIRLVTFERPRLIGLWRSAGDLYNDARGWLTSSRR